MKRLIFYSGGKDSNATTIICHEKGIHVDGVVMSEVMFDHKRNISGENPEHIKWVYETAIPIIEKQFGYKVIVLRDKSDYLQQFNHIIYRSPVYGRNGKKRGFLIGGKCKANSDLKMRPIKQFLKSIKEPYEEIVGIAADEPERQNKKTMKSKGKNKKRSILVEFGITEAMTYDICRKYNLLSPIYNSRKRGGCWFCPNQGIEEFAALKKNYPELWQELKILSNDKQIVSQGFKYGQTFFNIEQQVDTINNQISLFDYLEEK